MIRDEAKISTLWVLNFTMTMLSHNNWILNLLFIVLYVFNKFINSNTQFKQNLLILTESACRLLAPTLPYITSSRPIGCNSFFISYITMRWFVHQILFHFSLFFSFFFLIILGSWVWLFEILSGFNILENVWFFEFSASEIYQIVLIMESITL